MTRKTSKFGWLEFILGALLIILGLYTFLSSEISLNGAIIAYGLVAIVTGFVDISTYASLDDRTGAGPTVSLVAGILSILAGIILFFNPFAGGWTLSILFPVWFVAHCIARLCNLPLTKHIGGAVAYWVSIITNVIGLVLGVILLLDPWVSIFSYVYIVGAYMLLLGIESVVIAFTKMSQ